MRSVVSAALLALLLLAGCRKSFDDRYAEAQKQVGEQAVSIDRDLAQKASEAAMADKAAPSAQPSSKLR